MCFGIIAQCLSINPTSCEYSQRSLLRSMPHLGQWPSGTAFFTSVVLFFLPKIRSNRLSNTSSGTDLGRGREPLPAILLFLACKKFN